MAEEVSWGISVLGAGVLLFGVVFLFQLVAAPSRLEADLIHTHDEERSRLQADIDRLQTELADKLSHKEISEGLAGLHDKGQELLHRLLGIDQPDINEWGRTKDEWQAKVTQFLKGNVSASQASEWDSNHLFADERFTYNGRAYSGDKGRLAGQIFLLLEGLRVAAAGY